MVPAVTTLATQDKLRVVISTHLPHKHGMSVIQDLRDEFLIRKDRNGSYSLRAFARDLGISHTYLSLILAGKRRMSPSQSAQIGMLLGLSPKEVQQWIEQAIENREGQRGINPSLTRSLNGKQKNKIEFKDLQIEYSKVIAGWYYLPILEATYLKDAKADPKWFASRLGISTTEARDAIDRLMSLEMLEEKDGKLKKTNDFIRLPTSRSYRSMRAYYHSVFDKAREAMEDASPEAFKKRLVSGGTLAIKKTHIAKARERLKKFQDEFIAEYAATESDEVYQLSLQFFSLTQSKIKENKGSKI